MKLTPEWIVGFVDGDGSFKVVVDEHGYLRFVFVVSQNKRSISVLYAMKKFFCCGNVSLAGGDMAEFRVEKKEHLENVIFPFFDQYPLQTVTKKKDKEDLFQRWTEHHCCAQKQRIIQNVSLTESKKTYNGPTLKLKNPVNPCLYQTEDWLAGFIDAEGCFCVSMVDNNPRPQLILGSDERNFPLLENLVLHFKIGTAYKRKNGFAIFQVNKLTSDLPKLFQLFKSPPNSRLHTIKKISYGLFVKIVTSWVQKEPKRIRYTAIKNGEAYQEMLTNLTLDSPFVEGLPQQIESRRKLIIKLLNLCAKLNKYIKYSSLEVIAETENLKT